MWLPIGVQKCCISHIASKIPLTEVANFHIPKCISHPQWGRATDPVGIFAQCLVWQNQNSPLSHGIITWWRKSDKHITGLVSLFAQCTNVTDRIHKQLRFALDKTRKPKKHMTTDATVCGSDINFRFCILRNYTCYSILQDIKDLGW